MYLKKILHKNYTINRKFYQLKLPFDIGCIIPDNDSVRLLNQFVDDMHLTELYVNVNIFLYKKWKIIMYNN